MMGVALPILVVGAVAVDPPASEPANVHPVTEAVRVPTARLEIPNEIAPAVVAYLQCLLASRGVEVRREGRLIDPVAQQGADCAAAREEAARRADQMLRTQRRGSREERARFIEAALTSVDNFAATSAAPPRTSSSNASD